MLTSLFAIVGITPAITAQALLDDVSKRAFNYFYEQTSSSGLTKDRAINLGTSDTYTVASVAATGFALAAYAIGSHRGWKPRADLLAKAQTTLYTINTKVAKQNGWLYHFVDKDSGVRSGTSEVSSIDTAIFLAGALMAEREFKDPTLTSRVNRFVSNIDWNWMLTDGGAKPTSLTFSMGWTPESGFLPYRWDTYSELMILYIEALGASPSVPTATWSAWKRPWVSYAGYGLLSGGPMFMHQLTQGFLDFSGQRDSLGWDYWVDSYHDTMANRAYCTANPNGWYGYSQNRWGMTACDTPTGYQACGAPGWGVDDGTLAPTASIGADQFVAWASQAAALSFYSTYPGSYGRYGFSNALNATKKWVDRDVIGIDLGMAMLNIEAARDHLPQTLSLQHPIMATGMSRAGFHATSEGALTYRALYVKP